MISSMDAENFESGRGDQSHLFQRHESVSGSESEGKRMPAEAFVGLEQPTLSTNHSPPDNRPSKRTLQNRKAQREFRERKASYVKSLEQRIRAYESNEVQGNVELQRAARRLKEENEQLREQVRQLSERLSTLEGGNIAMAGMPPTRTIGRSRGGSNSAHHQQQSQAPPQALYNQPQGFTNDVTYDMMSSESSFPSANPQGYSQYFAQQQHYNSYAQQQSVYGQEQASDVSLNPDLKRTSGRGDNVPGRPSPTQ